MLLAPPKTISRLAPADQAAAAEKRPVGEAPASTRTHSAAGPSPSAFVSSQASENT